MKKEVQNNEKKRTYARRRILRDPVYGYLYLHDYEDLIVHTSLFQRLRRITQTHSVFPFYAGAVHSRYQHSLGVAHVAGEFANFLLEDAVTNGDLDESKKKSLVKLARVWGLLHDIGHGPFSHAFEDYVLRLSPVKIGSYEIDNHDSVGLFLAKNDKELKNSLNIVESRLRIKANQLLDVFRMKSRAECESKPGQYEMIILENVFWGKYGADFIDFLQRDALYAGTPEYGTLDWRRLVLTSHIFHQDETKTFCLEDRSKHTLYSFVSSFFQMYQAVYFNKNVRAMDNLFGRFLRAVNDTRFFEDFLHVNTEAGCRKFHTLDEYLLLGIFSQPYDNNKLVLQGVDPQKFEKAHALCHRILKVDVRCDDVIEKIYAEKAPPNVFQELDMNYFEGMRSLGKMTEKILLHIQEIFSPSGLERIPDTQKDECFIDTPRLEKKRCPLYETQFFGFLDRYENFQEFEQAEHPFLNQIPPYIDILRLHLHNDIINKLCEIETQNYFELGEEKLLFVNKKNSSKKTSVDLDHEFFVKLKSIDGRLSWMGIVDAIVEEVTTDFPKDKVLRM